MQYAMGFSCYGHVLLLLGGFLIEAPSYVFGGRCSLVSVPECQGLGYNLTVFPPPVLSTEEQTETEMVLQSFLPLLEKCSRHGRFLVCSVVSPMCSEIVPRPIPACRGLCEQVQTECAALQVPWPALLDCGKLPQPEKHGLCMEVPEEQSRPTKAPRTWVVRRYTTASILHFHNAVCPVNFTLVGSVCSPICNSDALYSSSDKTFAENWLVGWSTVCFLLTGFSLLTFWAEPSRFRFPERPVLYLTLCYNLLGLSHLLRAAFGSRVCDGFETSPPCLALYLLTGYLTLSAAMWWLLLATCWYLSAAKKWSAEALERRAGVFHLVAWLPPIVPPAAALLWNVVRPHELTGLCNAPGFIELPAGALLSAGAVLGTLTGGALLRVRQDLVLSGRSAHKLSRLMLRLAFCWLIFLIPASAALICGIYELHPTVLPCLVGGICPSPARLKIVLPLTRIMLLLGGGGATGMWAWSRKSCRAWGRLGKSAAPSKIRPPAVLRPLTRPPIIIASHTRV